MYTYETITNKLPLESEYAELCELRSAKQTMEIAISHIPERIRHAIKYAINAGAGKGSAIGVVEIRDDLFEEFDYCNNESNLLVINDWLKSLGYNVSHSNGTTNEGNPMFVLTISWYRYGEMETE